MNPWLFFGLFAVLLALLEFLSRKSVATTRALLPPDERSVSLRRRAAVRVAGVLWWAVIVAATIAWWFGSDLASGVLGLAFVVAALGAALSALSWLSNRRYT